MVRSSLIDGPVLLDVTGVEGVLSELRRLGHTLIGPTRRDGAIVLDEITSTADLPQGWGDEQGPGRSRLHRRDDDAWFGWAVGPTTWRRFLSPPVRELWRARRDGHGFELVVDDAPAPPLALIGVRPCDLVALGIQDRVAAGGPCPDTDLLQIHRDAFVLAVSCGAPAATCFCASTGTGPRAGEGADLTMIELVDDAGHRFVVEATSARGAEVLASVPHPTATEADQRAADAVIAAATAAQSRTLPDRDACARLVTRAEHPHWADVAERCLSCASCTLVCPTCFCSRIADRTDLAGDEAWRSQRWDSCFSLDHSFIHGGSIRADVRARYRQWLTHKLATWWDQLDTSGCVGCGRCITWCPAGIDLTVEARAIVEGAADAH